MNVIKIFRKTITLAILLFISTLTLSAQNGLSIPLEPTLGKIDFDSDINLRDTWYAGASTGFGIGENAGVRVFYWKALENGELTTETDNLSIYGAESRFKVNIANLQPYISIGGGKIDVGDKYFGVDSIANAQDRVFGLAGAGLDIRIIRGLNLTGYVKDFITSNATDSSSTFYNNWSYGGSINLVIGDKKKQRTSSPELGEMGVNEQPVYIQKDRTVTPRVENKQQAPVIIQEPSLTDEDVDVLNDNLEVIADELGNINQEMNKQNNTIKNLEQRVTDLENKKIKIQLDDNDTTSEPEVIIIDQDGQVVPQEQSQKVIEKKTLLGSKLISDGSSFLLGTSLGNANTFNIGGRLHYLWSGNEKLHIMPEAVVGLGSKNTFSLGVLGAHDINISSLPQLAPYVGGGVGFINDDGVNATYQFMAGTKFNNVANGRVYADYQSKNLFKYNQLAVGYHF